MMVPKICPQNVQRPLHIHGHGGRAPKMAQKPPGGPPKGPKTCPGWGPREGPRMCNGRFAHLWVGWEGLQESPDGGGERTLTTVPAPSATTASISSTDSSTNFSTISNTNPGLLDGGLSRCPPEAPLRPREAPRGPRLAQFAVGVDCLGAFRGLGPRPPFLDPGGPFLDLVGALFGP